MKPRLFTFFGLLLVLALAAYLRLANNAETPGWYTDEGTHLEIARHLAQGRMQYMAINQSTFLFAKLPLFELLLAGLLPWGSEGIAVLRTFTGFLGVLSVALLYGFVRQASGERGLALTAALLLAISPQAVLYSRFGFSYNLLAPLLLLAVLGLWLYIQADWPENSRRRAGLALAALALGLGTVSDLWMFMIVLPFVVVVLARRWQDLLWSLPLLLLPFGLYVAYMLLAAPEAFLFDLDFTRSRLSNLTLLEQAGKLATNYMVLATGDPWLALALVGLFLLRPLRLQLLIWLLLGTPILLLGRTEALYHLSFYYMIPLLPLISLGVAILLWQGIPFAADRLQQALADFFPVRLPDRGLRWVSYLTILALAATPFLMTTINLGQQIQDRFTTAIDPFLIEPPFARYAARFINTQTASEDLVIASPGVAWQFLSHVADFQMAVAVTGQATPHLPAHLPPARLAFNPDYRQARFVVVDNLWHTWAVPNVNGVAGMLDTIQRWPIVFQSGPITIYCNPDEPDC